MIKDIALFTSGLFAGAAIGLLIGFKLGAAHMVMFILSRLPVELQDKVTQYVLKS